MASAERPDQDEESGQDWDSFVAEHGELEEMAPDIDWSKLAPDEKSLERDRQKQRESLEKNADKWAWMKERKHQQMFSEIENKLQGALGLGTFDWVDRRVFDQVFDRLTLLSIYKLMKKSRKGYLKRLIKKNCLN